MISIFDTSVCSDEDYDITIIIQDDKTHNLNKNIVGAIKLSLNKSNIYSLKNVLLNKKKCKIIITNVSYDTSQLLLYIRKLSETLRVRVDVIGS